MSKPLPGCLLLCFLTTGFAQERSIKLPGWISSVAFSPDGQSLASGGSDNFARIRNANTGTETALLAGHTDYVASVAFAPDGRTLATGSYDHTARIWDLASSQTRQVLKGHRGVVMSVAFRKVARNSQPRCDPQTLDRCH